MLNSCIKHKTSREALLVPMETDSGDSAQAVVRGLESCSSEDEFFECDLESSGEQQPSPRKGAGGCGASRSNSCGGWVTGGKKRV